MANRGICDRVGVRERSCSGFERNKAKYCTESVYQATSVSGGSKLHASFNPRVINPGNERIYGQAMKNQIAVSTNLLLVLALLSGVASAGEKGIFDYGKQRAANDEVTKIVFIGDAGTHGPRGNHEFIAASIYLARQLNATYPNVHAVVHSSENWPSDLAHADSIVVGLNHGGRAATDAEIFAAVRQGAGFIALHYGVEVDKGQQGNNYLQWMGGYFETNWSVNPWWTPNFQQLPKHPITRGVKPFSVRDEWYYHMRFVAGMEGVTPILSDVPPLSSISKEMSDRGGNPDVYNAVSEGKTQHMAWAYDRPDGGRGFGFTGLHLHQNLEHDDFRKILLNGVAWVSKQTIPKDGVASKSLSQKDSKQLIDEAIAAVKEGK